MKRTKGVAWFSAGVTSAVATKLALIELQDKVELDIVFFETGNHHPDTHRFLKDCENWFNKEVTVMKNDKFVDCFDVFRKQKFINSPYGAPCTTVFKKNMRIKYEKENNFAFQVFGFEYEKHEINRAIRFQEQYPASKSVFPLIEKKITKVMAIEILENEGIAIPEMYKLGYNNNNCIGCVKGGQGYWNKIRKDFPDTFNKMKELEKELNATCLKQAGEKLFLDELDPLKGLNKKPVLQSCGAFCTVELQHILSNKLPAFYKGQKVFDSLQDRLIDAGKQSER